MTVHNPSNQTSLAALEATLYEAVQNIKSRPPLHISPHSYAYSCGAFFNNMCRMFREQSTPGDYFDFMDNGAFKECYSTGIDGWVVKFFSEENETATEEQILNLTHDYDIQEVFAPSIYIHFPFALPATYLGEVEPEDSWDDDYTDRPMTVVRGNLVGCILQPTVTTAGELGCREIDDTPNRAKYSDNPVRFHSGDALPYKMFSDLAINYKPWVQDAIDHYGDSFFCRFYAFVTKYRLYDLHKSNIGFMTLPDGRVRPVILDWLSRSIKAKEISAADLN